MTTATEEGLVSLRALDVSEVFTADGVEPLIKKIEDEVRSVVCEVETDKGRKQVKSLAAKVSSAKVMLDNSGKELVKEWKQKAKKVDGARKVIRDRLDSLRDETRKPVTDYEEERAAKVKALQVAAELEEAHEEAIEANELFDLRKEKEKREAEELAAKEKADAEAKAIADKEAQAEREEQIRKDAAAKAKKEAEDKAAAEIQKVKDDAAKEEQDRLDAEEESRKKKEAAQLADDKRIADENHRNQIHNSIIDALEANGIHDAEKIVDLIVEEKIPRITIIY